MFSTSADSTQVRGVKRSVRESRRAVKRSKTSPSRTMERASRPCLVAFREDLSLPSGVAGPVDLAALARLVAVRDFEGAVGSFNFFNWIGSFFTFLLFTSLRQLPRVGRAWWL